MSTTKTRVSVPLMPALALTGGAVALVGRHDQQHLRADGLADETFVPPGDDAALADHEVGRRAAVPRRVELLAAVVDHAGVVDADRLPRLHDRAGARDQRLHDQRGRARPRRSGW